MNLSAFRWAILFVGVFCLIIVAVALQQISTGRLEPWATIAAVLAVVASLFSAWIAQRVFEEQKAAQAPYPYPELDMYSRMGLALLKVVNKGSSTAFDISLEWEDMLPGVSEQMTFVSGQSSSIHVLSPNSQVARLLGGANDFLEKVDEGSGIYKGTVKFKDGSGKLYHHPFVVSAEQYRESLTFEAEQQAAFKEIQKLPKVVEDLKNEVKQIRIMGDAIAEFGWPLKEALAKQEADELAEAAREDEEEES